MTSTGATSRIMHPPEDISLEELRARLPKYKRTTPVPRVSTPSTSSSSVATITQSQAQAQASLQQAIVEVFLLKIFDICIIKMR